ncbi:MULTISPECIES: transcriptional repressor AgaR [Chryseolinea]|jgi:DeoR family transcriptional regulator of aga operon|uniref:Transcriptional regulator, DeoR family n=2 Tax=Chryseolinea TaxID=1433993 RepID=A0A1M5JJC7_9BACT|nr:MULTISPECIES: transcriptional repressor AgaR [Chryseolinea]AYB33405.1 DeoR/GlpR transcriptional regulator [Chryseolinea soli]SHG40657.1 transcriptional regulator, DeoR family [Chryseolinea serpens]
MAKKRDSTVGRRKEILHLLSEKGEVFVEELSKLFSVSEVTIRNDLDQLEQKNTLIRARGGALKFETGVANDQRLADKSRINFQEKARIGKVAAQLITESDTIIIDSGSTTSELVRNLPDLQDLTVITNALNIANQLITKPNINMIMPGGYLRKNSLSLVGPLAEKSLRNFNVDKAFLGVDGFDTRQGVFTPNVEEARLNEIMIEISKEVILLVDSSKFKKRSLAFICSIEQIDKVITDTNITPDDKKRLQDAGVEVITV